LAKHHADWEALNPANRLPLAKISKLIRTSQLPNWTPSLPN